MAHTKDDTVGALFGVVIVVPILGSISAGAFTLVWQALQWLKTAIWPNLTLRDGLHWWNGQTIPNGWTSGMLGLDKLLAWCLDGSPLFLWLMLILPVAWGFIGGYILSLLFPERSR